MLFLNPWMLMGLLGVSVPLMIHLFNWRKQNRREWGAMMFLEASLAQRRRRVLVEEILLLATRCLIVAFAALAFARPFVSAGSAFLWVAIGVTGLLAVIGLAASAAVWSQPGLRKRLWIAAGALGAFAIASILVEGVVRYARASRSGARDVAIILDGSSSMTITSEGVRNFDEAKKVADAFIQSCPRNTAFAVIVGGSVPVALTPAPTTDRRLLFRLLDEAVPLQGTMQAPDALALAASVLSQGYNGNKQVLVVGDGQAEGWHLGDDDTWACVGELFSHLPGRPKVVWRTLPIPSGLRNLTVTGIAFSRDVIGTDREVRIDVTVANNGEEAATPHSITLSAEGRNYTDSSIGQLQPSERRTVSFRHRFRTTGTHPVTATLDVEDELVADNTLVRIAAVRGEMRVLVVEGAKSSRLSGRPGAFLALALSPTPATVEPLNRSTVEPFNRQVAKQPNQPTTQLSNYPTFFRPELVDAAGLDAISNLTAYAAIVLADVPTLQDATAERLAAYVERGGGLFAVNASRSSAAFYNGWRDADAAPFLPLVLEGDSPANSEGVPIDPRTLVHPALAELAEHGDLATAIFENIWKTSPSETSGVRVGGRLFDGSPLFADRKAGKGHIVQFAAALDPAAGNLISRQSFLPMVHELLYYLARPVAPDLNLRPARGVSLALAGGAMPDLPEDVTAHGLRGVYRFAKDGSVRKVAINRNFDMNWGSNPMDPVLPHDAPMKVEWTGSLTVPRSGTYNIYVRSAGSATVAFADDRKHFGLSRSNIKVDLVAGERHDFVVTYSGRNRSNSYLSLRWNGPNIGDQVIPAAYLSPLRVTDKEWAETYQAQVAAPDSLVPLSATLRLTRDSLSLHVPHRLTPGVYTASIPAVFAPQLAELSTLSNGFARLSFCVATDGAESRLASVMPEEAAFAARYVDFSVADNPDDMNRAMNGAAIGRELWRYAAVPLLLLLLLEILLTRWITEQRRTGEEGRVAFDEANKPSSRFNEILRAIQNGGRA